MGNSCPFPLCIKFDIVSDGIFGNPPEEKKPAPKKKPFVPYDWDGLDNCSDREYMDDDDYDDFDN